MLMTPGWTGYCTGLHKHEQLSPVLKELSTESRAREQAKEPSAQRGRAADRDKGTWGSGHCPSPAGLSPGGTGARVGALCRVSEPFRAPRGTHGRQDLGMVQGDGSVIGAGQQCP